MDNKFEENLLSKNFWNKYIKEIQIILLNLLKEKKRCKISDKQFYSKKLQINGYNSKTHTQLTDYFFYEESINLKNYIEPHLSVFNNQDGTLSIVSEIPFNYINLVRGRGRGRGRGRPKSDRDDDERYFIVDSETSENESDISNE